MHNEYLFCFNKLLNANIANCIESSKPNSSQVWNSHKGVTDEISQKSRTE